MWRPGAARADGGKTTTSYTSPSAAHTAGIQDGLAAYLGAPIEHFNVLGTGWETTIFEFVLGSRSSRSDAIPDHTPLVLRFYQGSLAPAKAMREAATLKRLATGGYPVPRPYLLEPGAGPLGAPFLIMQRLEGSPIFAISSFAYAFKTFSLGFTGFVRAQARLHGLSSGTDRQPAFVCSAVTNDAPLLDRLLGLISERIEQGPLPGLKDALARLQDGAGRYRDAAGSIVHMDYHPQNVLVRGVRVTGVIDWVNADCGDRHLDAATTSVILASTAMEHPRWMRESPAGNFLRATFAAMYMPLYHAAMPMDLARFRYCQGVAALLRLSMFGMMRTRGAEAMSFRPEAIANVTPPAVRILSRYAARKIGVPASI